MKKGFIFLTGGYSIWIILNIAITVFQIGDAGVNAHFALLFTGFPASVFSLLVPHGSLLGVLIAGILGLLQWGLFIKLARNNSNEKRS